MVAQRYEGPLERVTPCCWRIPKCYKTGMRVDGLIYADEKLVEQIRADPALEQVANVAFLPGIQYASLAMPDIHWSYGFPIGGVCATDPAEGGVISPGGVGYDINCGVRLVRSNLLLEDVQPHLESLIQELFQIFQPAWGEVASTHFPTATCELSWTWGRSGWKTVAWLSSEIFSSRKLTEGLMVRNPNVSATAPSTAATTNAAASDLGNHFMEVQVVEHVFDETAARLMGLEQNMVCVMIHSGSRGLGYQVCDDALRKLRNAPAKYGIELPDRQLVCAPVDSPQGETYLGAMRAAANFAWCNRQLLMWQAREVFDTVFGRTWQELDMHLVYDVAHNIAKFEEHVIDGEKKRVCVHRKGATRAFPPNTPRCLQSTQPLASRFSSRRHGPSQLGVGRPGREHGADLWQRLPRRGSSNEPTRGNSPGSRPAIDRELRAHGIVARARSWKGLAEEQPAAYKDVDVVVEVVHKAGLAKKVARLRPIGVIKG